MKDFILNLYSSDNFTMYVTIALVILVALFLIILFFGKKDKKLQETQRLQKVTDTFKEEPTENKIEVVKEEQEEPKLIASEEKALIEDKTDVIPVVKMEETKEEPIKEEQIEEPEEVKVTVMEPEKEEKELVQEDIKELNFDEINNSLEKELTELENLKNEINNLEIPQVEEKKEEVKEEEKEKPTGPQVFSSVFINKPAVEDFELPTLKKDEEVKEEKKEENQEEVKTFSFDDISGETYNLNNK